MAIDPHIELRRLSVRVAELEAYVSEVNERLEWVEAATTIADKALAEGFSGLLNMKHGRSIGSAALAILDGHNDDLDFPPAFAEVVRSVRAIVKPILASASAERAKRADPRHAAMLEIRSEFDRWQRRTVRYANDADFAKKMHAKYAATIRNEGSIKNACTRWRKAHKSSA